MIEIYNRYPNTIKIVAVAILMFFWGKCSRKVEDTYDLEKIILQEKYDSIASQIQNRDLEILRLKRTTKYLKDSISELRLIEPTIKKVYVESTIDIDDYTLPELDSLFKSRYRGLYPGEGR